MYKKKVTIADLAEYTGYSQATISRAMANKGMVKDETRQKISEAMDALGYTRSDNSKSACNGLILMNVPNLENTFYNDVAKGIKASADNHQYNLLINMEQIGEGTIKDVLNLIRQTAPDGLITTTHVEARFLNQISKLTKVVQCSEYCAESDLSFVSIDDYRAAKIAVDHIIATGRNRIAFINGNPTAKYAQERMRGFMDSLSEANIPIVDEWVVQSPIITFDVAFALASQMLSSSPMPNAFFASADVYAAAIIRAAQEKGLQVPQDVVVVGFDNLDVSRMTTPPITTVSQPRFQQGFTATELLINMIQTGFNEQRKIYLDTELIVRQSSFIAST